MESSTVTNWSSWQCDHLESGHKFAETENKDQSLGPTLAEFDPMPLARRRVGPGTTRTVESVWLIDDGERAGGRPTTYRGNGATER